MSKFVEFAQNICARICGGLHRAVLCLELLSGSLWPNVGPSWRPKSAAPAPPRPAASQRLLRRNSSIGSTADEIAETISHRGLVEVRPEVASQAMDEAVNQLRFHPRWSVEVVHEGRLSGEFLLMGEACLLSVQLRHCNILAPPGFGHGQHRDRERSRSPRAAVRSLPVSLPNTVPASPEVQVGPGWRILAENPRN